MAASDVESTAPALAPVSFEGTACARPQVLRSPVSGQPCVYWCVGRSPRFHGKGAQSMRQDPLRSVRGHELSP
jgi:hypothetical protein